MNASITINGLIAAYKTDKVSPYRKLRYFTRKNYDSHLARISTDYGTMLLADVRRRTLVDWHETWCERGIPMAHGLMTRLRVIINFGVGFLEDDDCSRISSVLRTMKFENGGSRVVHLTANMADAIRAEAHKQGCPSVALAQAIQFEGTFRQKDILGEWVPNSEPGMSEVTSFDDKWLRGIRWNEIDANLVLHHITSKKTKPVHVPLIHAPMVLDELERVYGSPLTRDKLPVSGPVIVDESTGLPWIAHQFRYRWRALARACGIPDNVQNRDSRAGAITEAIANGVSIEDAGKAAAHATTAMTAKYSRGDAEAIERTMRKRAEGRARIKEKVA